MANAKIEIGRLSCGPRSVPSGDRPLAERSVVTDIPVLRAMIVAAPPANDELVMTIEAEYET